MTLKQSMLAAACAGAAMLSFIPFVHADEWNKKTLVTVNEPVIAGNRVLQPGTYIWKLMDSSSNRNIVRIYNNDESKLETTVLSIPNYRLHPNGKTQFAFWETPAGVPKAIRVWFYPGDNFGQEFAYPKKLVAQLASVQPVPVPTNYNPPPETAEAAPTPEPRPEPQPVAAPEPPSPAPVAAPAPPQGSERVVVQEPKSLPTTASYAPLVGLVGLFSLGFFGVLTLASTKR
jgi:hypothetical protein